MLKRSYLGKFSIKSYILYKENIHMFQSSYQILLSHPQYMIPKNID